MAQVTVRFEAIQWWFGCTYCEAINLSTILSKWFILEIEREYLNHLYGLTQKGGENDVP
jgi:hypothetical protein